MDLHEELQAMSLDEIIADALQREGEMLAFYEEALHNVGPDSVRLFHDLVDQQRQRMDSLRWLAAEAKIMRDLTAPIAD